MATSITGTLGRNFSYTNDATGITDFTNEWLTAAQNQGVSIFGTSTSTFNHTGSADLSLLDFSTNPPQNLTNLALTTTGQAGNDTFGSQYGIGVADSYDGWWNDPTKIRAEINYNPNNGQSQVLTFQWAPNQTITSAFIDLSVFASKAGEKYGDEVGFLQAFNNGAPVSVTAVRMVNESTVSSTQTSIQNAASGVTFTADRADGDYKFKVFGTFDELRFSAKAYVNPSSPQPTNSFGISDSSDYLVQQLKYTGTEQPIGTLQFGAPVFSVNEDGTPVLAVTVTRTGGSFGAVSATVVPSDGTALFPADYNNNPIVVNFADGDTATKTITIPIVDDTLVEGNETVNLDLVNPTGGATLGPQDSAVLTILDNDAPGTLQFSNPQYVVGEDGTPVLAVTVTRTGGSAGTVSGTVTPTDGTALFPADYNNNPIVVTFANGDTAPKTVTIPIVDDALVEPDETVNLTLSNPTGGATLGTQTTAVLTILDNDTPPPSKPVVFVAALDPVAGEPGRSEGNGTFQFARTGGDITQPLTIRYTVTGTATSGTDYGALTGTVTIAAGASVSAPVTVIPSTDGQNEPTESVVVKVAEDPAYQVGSADTASVSILDNDPLTGTPQGANPILRYNSSGVFIGTHTNITSAVAAASANDIIVAQAGTYNEPGTVIIDKALTLRGPNAGVSPSSSSLVSPAIVQTGAGIPVFTILPGVNNVTIEGLQIQMGGENAIRLQGNSSNLVIRQNNFTGPGAFNSGILFLDTGGANPGSSVFVIDNLMRDVTTAAGSTTSGVQAFRFDTVRITDNQIANLTGPGVAADSIINPASVINSNKVTNTGEQGLQLAGGNATIENNDVTNTNTISGTDRGGIRLRNSGFGAAQGGLALGTANVISNVLTNSFNGLAIRDGDNITGNVAINYNNFIGNTNAGLSHGGSGALNAENNWWDSITGPTIASNPGGMGQAIVGTGAGSVDFDPFLTTPL